MLRFVSFLVAAFLLSRLLGHLPVIGGFFRATGIFGVWITALLLAWLVTHWGARTVRVQRQRSQLRDLEAVDSPHNRGKMGSLYLAQGRARKAAELFEEAARGEPEVAEWHYRLGCAELASGNASEAIASLRRATEIDEEYGYGGAQMRLAEATLLTGDPDASLEALQRFERNHGPSPESAYRRGKALKRLGRGDEARGAFGEVGELANRAVRYQKGEAQKWLWKARLASLL